MKIKLNVILVLLCNLFINLYSSEKLMEIGSNLLNKTKDALCSSSLTTSSIVIALLPAIKESVYGLYSWYKIRKLNQVEYCINEIVSKKNKEKSIEKEFWKRINNYNLEKIDLIKEVSLVNKSSEIEEKEEQEVINLMREYASKKIKELNENHSFRIMKIIPLIRGWYLENTSEKIINLVYSLAVCVLLRKIALTLFECKKINIEQYKSIFDISCGAVGGLVVMSPFFKVNNVNQEMNEEMNE